MALRVYSAASPDRQVKQTGNSVDFFVFISEQWILVSILLVLVYLLAITEKIKSGKAVGVHEATRLLNTEQAVLVDIRESKEFTEGHIANAVNIPFNKVNERMAELEKRREKVIILADKLGQHSGAVGRNLQKQGYQVRRLAGGIAEWQNQNLPLVKS